jgi:hypothetical protein
MKLTQNALEAIDNQAGRLALMAALGFREGWIIKVIKANKPNGPLTKMAAVKAICDLTGMGESQVLEPIAEFVKG